MPRCWGQVNGMMSLDTKNYCGKTYMRPTMFLLTVSKH